MSNALSFWSFLTSKITTNSRIFLCYFIKSGTNIFSQKFQPNTIFKELYPASMNDIRMWNIREMRICIEWAKTFEVYQKMNQFDQVIFQISTLEIIILAENLKNLYNYRLQFSAKSVKFWNILNLLFQFALVRNFAFAFNLLNRVFYSQDHGPDKIVFQNGAFIMRQPQQQVKKRNFSAK